MKKKRIVIKKFNESTLDKILDEPETIPSFILSFQEASPPSGGAFLLTIVKVTDTRIDARYYLSQEDYMSDYLSLLVQLRNRDDYVFYSFALESNSWNMFFPPPVFSPDLTTRLRPNFGVF